MIDTDPHAVQQVSSVWLKQLRAEYVAFGDEVTRLNAELAERNADYDLLSKENDLLLSELARRFVRPIGEPMPQDKLVSLQLHLLGWNRSQAQPPIKPGYEYGVAAAILDLFSQEGLLDSAAGQPPATD